MTLPPCSALRAFTIAMGDETHEQREAAILAFALLPRAEVIRWVRASCKVNLAVARMVAAMRGERRAE